MFELILLISVVFAGLIVLTPIVGITIYIILRPWLVAYTAKQNAVAATSTAIAPDHGQPFARVDR